VCRALRSEDTSVRWTLAYPGHGLRAAELQELEDILQAMDLQTEGLVCQERLGQVSNVQLPTGIRVAISGGGRSIDVDAAGLGMKHVQDLMIRLARRLLEG